MFRILLKASLLVFVFLGSCTTTKRVVFDENWTSLLDPEMLTHWQPSNFFDPGPVQIEIDHIHLGTGNNLTGVTWTGPHLHNNYEIELAAQRISGSDFFCGLTVPYRDDEHFSLICGGWGGSLVGISCIDYFDAANNMTTTVYPFENQQWYTIHLRVTEERIQVWINDELIIDQETEGHHFSVRDEVEKSKPFGLASWQTEARIRNLHVRAIPSF